MISTTERSQPRYIKKISSMMRDQVTIEELRKKVWETEYGWSGPKSPPPYTYTRFGFAAGIGKLINPEELVLRKNNLSKLPEKIGNMISLEELNLTGNRITRLPDTIASLYKLKRLYIQDNPLMAGEKERIKTLLPHCRISF